MAEKGWKQFFDSLGVGGIEVTKGYTIDGTNCSNRTFWERWVRLYDYERRRFLIGHVRLGQVLCSPAGLRLGRACILEGVDPADTSLKTLWAELMLLSEKEV